MEDGQSVILEDRLRLTQRPGDKKKKEEKKDNGHTLQDLSSAMTPRLVAGVGLLVGCLTSQQHASVSQGRICSDKFTCCHTEIEVGDKLSASPSRSILTPGRPVPALTLYHQALSMTRPGKIPSRVGFEPWIFHSRGGRVDALTTRPRRRLSLGTEVVSR